MAAQSQVLTTQLTKPHKYINLFLEHKNVGSYLERYFRETYTKTETKDVVLHFIRFPDAFPVCLIPCWLLS
jgi:hypothetical protein